MSEMILWKKVHVENDSGGFFQLPNIHTMDVKPQMKF